MADDFYPFVDSGDPAPDNAHLNGTTSQSGAHVGAPAADVYTTRIAVYDDMLSTPRVVVITQNDVRAYLEEVTNTVYRCMKEQGGNISLMVIREIVENFIHARFMEPIISVLDNGSTIRFADQGPGIADKERAFDFGVTSADRDQKRYIRGTGAGFPMVQQYLENAGGAISIEDNLNKGTVITVSVDPVRVAEIERAGARGAAVRGGHPAGQAPSTPQMAGAPFDPAPGLQPSQAYGAQVPNSAGTLDAAFSSEQEMPLVGGAMGGMPIPQAPASPQQQGLGEGAPQQNPYGTGWQADPQMGGMPPQPWGIPQAPGMHAPGAQGAGFNPWAQPYPQQLQQPYVQGYPYQGYGQQMGQMGQMPPMGMGYAPMPAAYQAYPQGMAHQAPPQQPGVNGGMPYVNERGREALQYLATYEMCGPTDLATAYGHSNATWSRELNALANAGLVAKHGQKRILTDMGRYWLQENQ